MPALQTRIFTGATAEEATTALWAAIADGSFPVVRLIDTDQPLAMWITHQPVMAGMMQQPTYELHVTAWVETPEPTPHTEGV